MGKYYAVTVGKNPRVYSSWIEAAANIRNIPGGPIYQGFSSEEKAIRAFNAAMARGEVRAYPNVKSDLDESFDDAPLSPLGGEAALLRTPADVKIEEDAVQTPIHSRVAQLRRMLQEDSSPTSSSPATHVTQVNGSLYVDDDVRCSTPVARHHPHLTFDSSSARAYPSISGVCAQVQLEVSDGSSLFAPPTPKRMRLHPESPSKRKGVKYRSLSDLEEAESLDSRIWVPSSPIFSPDNVKRWPKSRTPSPTKRTTPLPGDEAVLVDAPFVRTGRGRHSTLTPSLSLPALPNRELEDDCALIESQAQESPRVRAKEIGCSLSDNLPVRRKHYVESHAQTVPSGDGESSIRVHCSASCTHAGSIHVPQRGMAPDLDVRSPISKGTLVPMNVAEALFGRPSPQFHSCNA